MYYAFFVLYLIVGVAMALWALGWAVRNGQFKEQDRARFLPLEQDHETPEGKS
jgi:nitrogen fixation-related uncharacterized protein